MNRKKPNVLFFLTDDQRYDAVNALGNPEIKTPNMDALVENGTAFTHAHIPCGTSAAVCMPSRAMLHTGRTLFHIEESGRSIPREHITIGESFREAGYTAFGTGKWHNGSDSFARGFNSGDDIFFGGMADHWNVPVCGYDASGRYDNLINQTPSFFSSNSTVKVKCDRIHPGKHSSELVADAGIRFLEKYENSAPFFAYLSFLAPHDPRTMPEEFLAMYDPERIKLPLNFMQKHPFDNGCLRVRDEELAALPRTPEETRRHIAEYYAMITHADFHIGRVLKKIEEKKILEDTIIVFAGDNGLALGRHGLFGKQNCYEHSVRVPLVFAGPGIPRNRKSPANAYLFDVFPTLCELTGTVVPGTSEGKSLVKAMGEPKESVRDSMYFAFADVQRAVKKSGYKLIEYVVNGRRTMTQLFNIEDDPLEMINLAGEPGFSAKLGEMRGELFMLRDEWDDLKTGFGKTFWGGYKFP